MEAFGGYDDNRASIIRSSLKTPMVLRFHVGWRPFRRYGLVVEAGVFVPTITAAVGWRPF